MADVFISYSRTDSDEALSLGAALTAIGVNVWQDTEIVAGENFRHTISEQLRASELVVVLWTKDSIKSDWVIGEAEDARKRQALLPVKVGPIEPPHDFRTLHTIDLTAWVPGEALPPPLIGALEKALGRPLTGDARTQTGTLSRIARSRYFQMESLLFYLISQCLACFLCNIPVAKIFEGTAPNDPRSYVVAFVIGLSVTPLNMRNWLVKQRINVATSVFLFASALSIMTYYAAVTLMFVKGGDALIYAAGPSCLLLLLVRDIADKALSSQ